MACDQMPKVIRPTGVATALRHAVQSAGGQRRELLQGLSDKRQVGINRRGPAYQPERWQSGLSQDSGDGVWMQPKLGGNGADAPAFGVVEAQDLRFNFWGKGQRSISCLSGNGAPGSEESPDAQIPAPADGTDDSATTEETRISSLSVRSAVEQAVPGERNPDASLSAVEPGIDVGVRRVRADRDGCLGSAGRPLELTGSGPVANILQCSSGCRDHSDCKGAQACGSRRTGSVFRGGPWAVTTNGSRRRRPLREILCRQRRRSLGCGAWHRI